ncbi:putative hcp-like protein [Erysiphe neolycopersici]|uniref:Putative hcp-like protein n=1 Tax=Erysiphe neolycopersici TaxID=212602 RepID=A0A420HWT2_9PEZI|nr:putative hcp-like protein [Erysiphe neolycopersici]
MSYKYRIPILATEGCNRGRIINSRAFHQSRLSLAQFSPSVIHKKRVLDRGRIANFREKKAYDCDESLPPIHLLKIAHEAGVLSIEPEQVLMFLRRYQHSLNHRQSSNWQQNLFKEFNITSLRTVTLIAAILRRCKTKAQRSLARTLMLFASTKGDKIATFEIITSALRSNMIHNYQEVFTRLKIIANNEGDQQAMMLLGKVLFYAYQSDTEALSWLQKANYPPTGNHMFDGAGESLVLEGRILQKTGDIQSAKIAFEKAAKELDEPEAYFYLSQIQENGSLIQQNYLLKAATAGITEAWYNLGVIELKKIMKNNPNIEKLGDFGIAREWFLVAAFDGNGPSMLNLAIMCKMIGDWTQAFEWLGKAKTIPSVSAESKKLLQEWKEVGDTKP